MSAVGSPRKAAAPAAAKAVDADVDLIIPDVIERLPKPDKVAHDAECAKIDAAIKKLQERSNVVRAEMDALKTGRGGYGEAIQAAKVVYGELRAQKDNLIQERNQITARVKQILEKKDATIKTQRSLKSSLRFQTEEEFDREIGSLRHQQETQSMSLMQEKRIIKEIEALQLQKQQVSKFSDEQSSVDKHNDSIKEMRVLQTKKNAEIDAVQEKLTEQKAVLDDLYQLNDQEKKEDQFPVLAKERKEIKEKLDAKFTEVKELRKAFKEANNKYFDNIRLVRKKKELERQKEEQARKAEYEAKLAEYEKEMAKIHPYQDEMDLCDALVSFLEKAFAKELKDEAAEVEESTGGPVELDGLKPMKRKDEDFMVMGGGKKKKGKKDGPSKKSKRETKLSLPLSQLESFSSIGLFPPSTVAALPESLKAIKEKKVWFNSQTTRPKAKQDAPVEAAAAAGAPAKSEPKKKGNKKFNAADESAFPTLGGSDAAPAAPVGVFGGSWGRGAAASVEVAEEGDDN